MKYLLFDYLDESERLLYQVVRFYPKKFYQRRWNDKKKEWDYKIKGVRRVLYRLPEVIKANKVFIVEGEKDVHTLEEYGFVATTCAGGSSSWREEYNEYFKNKEVIIIPDNDEAGKKFAITVARGIFPYAKTVKIIDLYYGIIFVGYDITDWFNDGHILEELITIINSTTNYITLKDLEREEPKLKDKPKYFSDSTNKNGNGITREMIDVALKYPIERLIQVNPNGKATCINSDHNDTEASMDCRNNFCFCYGCGFHGSTIDLAMKVWNVNFKEAVRKMNDN